VNSHDENKMSANDDSDQSDDNHSASSGWADTQIFKKLFVSGLVLCSVVAALAGFIPAFQKHHPHFAAEGIPVFFAFWGFVSFMFIVLVGQHLRKLIGREEGYYDERE